MACPFRILLVVVGALWAMVTMAPSKAVSVGLSMPRLRWPLLVLVLALHVDLFLQLGCTSCAAKFAVDAHSDLVGSLVEYFKKPPALEEALLS
jgi:hypothetical protein